MFLFTCKSIKRRGTYIEKKQGVKSFHDLSLVKNGCVLQVFELEKGGVKGDTIMGRRFNRLVFILIITFMGFTNIVSLSVESGGMEGENRLLKTGRLFMTQACAEESTEIRIQPDAGLQTGGGTGGPLIGVDPHQLDFGTVLMGEQVSRRLKVTNQGKDILKWWIAYDEVINQEPGISQNIGKYVSFQNEELMGSVQYVSPRHLRDKMDFQGKWLDERGYPFAPSDGYTLRYHFSGTGIAVFFRKGPITGQLTAFVDNRFAGMQEGVSEQTERFEWLVAEGLSGGPHILTLVNRNGPVVIEGALVYGEALRPIPSGQIAVSPNNGIITRQTNFVNVTIQTKKLLPGWYRGQVLFASSGGQKEVDLFLEVIPDNVPKVLDVYRYVRDEDYFLTINPQIESNLLQTRGYVKHGIAFRLFSPRTPGTTEFYRWFHPQKGDHYYGYDNKISGRNMGGYILEGTIGNIATSRLTNTRELYRWYHPKREHYFFTIDPKGEGAQKKGYQYDGIAGYVRP